MGGRVGGEGAGARQHVCTTSGRQRMHRCLWISIYLYICLSIYLFIDIDRSICLSIYI